MIWSWKNVSEGSFQSRSDQVKGLGGIISVNMTHPSETMNVCSDDGARFLRRCKSSAMKSELLSEFGLFGNCRHTALLYRHDVTALSLQKELVPWVELTKKPLLHYSTSRLLNSPHSQSAVKCSCGKRERGVTSWSLMACRKRINYDVSAFSLLLSPGGGKVTHIWSSGVYSTWKVAESTSGHRVFAGLIWYFPPIHTHSLLSHFSLHFLRLSESRSVFLRVPHWGFSCSNCWSFSQLWNLQVNSTFSKPKASKVKTLLLFLAETPDELLVVFLFQDSVFTGV